MASELLPRPQGPLTNPDGSPRAEWHDFWRILSELLDTAETDEERIVALEEAVAALQNAGVSVQITGPASVRVMGSAADGYVVTLDGDTPAPGDETFYGTQAGAKGWYARLLATLADVDLTDLADGDTLVWDGTDEKFVAGDAPASSQLIPLVTGEIPAVFVQLDDGSLVFVESDL